MSRHVFRLFGCCAEKDRRGLLGKIKDFVYDKAGWPTPSPAPERKNALPASVKLSVIMSMIRASM